MPANRPWRGSPNEADLALRTLKEIFPYFVFYLPPRQEVITYPIAGFNNDLRPGHRFHGPAVVEQTDTTTLVEPGMSVEVDTGGNLLVGVQ